MSCLEKSWIQLISINSCSFEKRKLMWGVLMVKKEWRLISWKM